MASWKTKGYVSDSEDDYEGTRVIRNCGTLTTPAVVDNPAENAPREKGEAVHRQTSAQARTVETPPGVSSFDSSILEAPPQHGIPNIELQSMTTAQPTASLEKTAEKLKESINRGFLLVREVLSRPASPQALSVDLDDSPLSTPPDSPTLFLAPGLVNDPAPLTAELIAKPAEGPNNQAVETIAPRRTLRQRNAIQQHPYSLEWAVYLKHCNERGIRPVQMPRPHSPTRSRRVTGSGDTQFEDDSQNQDSLGQESTELDDLDLIDGDASQDLDSRFEDDTDMNMGGDLPELQALLSSKLGRRRPHNQNKTKTSAPARTPTPQNLLTFEISSDDELGTPPLLKRSRISTKTQQESFPSPPRSMSIDTADLRPPSAQSSLPRSPAALPTPTLSSEIRPRKRPVVEDDTQSGAENEPVQDISSSSASELSETEPSSPTNVRLMQKKVKGVLPASWWTVDQAQKALDAKKKDVIRRSTIPRQEIGVAQRKSTNTPSRNKINPGNSTWYGDLVSDDDDAEAGSTKSPGEAHQTDTKGLEMRRNTYAVNSEAMEVVDDNGFDPMLPTQRRKKKERRPNETNLHGYIQENQRSKAGTSLATRVHLTISGQHRSRKKAKQKLSSDIVHVLDAPDLRDLEPERRPPFLRLAVRQAKAQKQVSGTSASRKFFQLEDEKGTMDINGELKTWKEMKRVRKHEPPPVQDSVRNKQTSHHLLIAEGDTSGLAHTGDWSNANSHSAKASIDTEPAQVRRQQSLGHVIQCGLPRTEDHALRLTRLRSLLPLTNRSGHGRFAITSAPSRSAQLEVLREDIRRLRVGVLRKPPVQVTMNTAIHSRSSYQRPFTARASGNDHPPSSLRKSRKQIPVYRPNLQQTRLAPSSPKSHLLENLIGQTSPQVRVLLEQEFVKHQTAWFQGSKSGVMVANHNTQRHFQTFLKVLKSYLPVALQDAEDGREARELRSFLHRLIPNRGQIGAQGQIGDKVFEVLEYDILVARNVFDLHTCLLNLAPGCAPRPRVLEMKVNFSDAHHEICVIALGAWKDICSYHHTDISIVDGLSVWIHSIISQLVHRWKAAESGARKEAVNSMRKIDEQLVRRVIDHNRSQACMLLTKALATLSLGVSNATGLAEANAFLNQASYQELLNITSQLSEMDDAVVESVLSLSTTYIKQQWHLQNPAAIANFLATIRQALTTLTSTRSKWSPGLQRTMAKVYFTLAKAAVTLRQRSWDEFYEPRSSHSLDMFIAESQLNSVKTYFYHFLLDHEPSQYKLELRAPVLSHWLRVLLNHSENLGCSLLTASLFRSEQDSLAMPSLAAMFQSPASVVDDSSLQDGLPEIRHATVMHIIQCLHGQENNAEAEWLVGGLEEIDAVRLLRIMFSTMKDTWMSLVELPEEQDVYTILVHSALDQYELYPRTDFTIDPWFLNSATFPQRRKQTFAKLFTIQFNTMEAFLKDVEEQFHLELMHARKYGQLTRFEEDLKHILLPTDLDRSFSTNEYTDMLLKHARFVQEVFPKIINDAKSNRDDIGTMLLKVLVHILDSLECRIDALVAATTQPLVSAILPVISVVSDSCVAADDSEQRLIYTLARQTFMWASMMLNDLPEGFLSDVKAICDSAATAESEEALMLLEAVMHMT